MNNRALEIAAAIYDAMDEERRKRVMRTFDCLLKDPTVDVRDVLVRAVDAEATASEREMMREPLEGTA